MCKMVVTISKETWKKCGIETINYYNEEKNVLMAKMGDIEIKLDHSNIADAVLKRIRKIHGRNRKNITEEEMRRYKKLFEGKKDVFIIEKVAIDVTERCKLPKSIDLRKKLEYNHNDIMIREETSIAEKIINLLTDCYIVLNKKFNNRKPDIWFENYDVISEISEGNHEIYDTDDEKETGDMLRRNNFTIF